MLPNFDHLDLDIELRPLGPGPIEMLVEPEPGTHLDLAPFDQVHSFHVLTPQRVVARVRDEAKERSRRHRDVRRDGYGAGGKTFHGATI